MTTSNVQSIRSVEIEYTFGPFSFIPSQQLLLYEAAPLRLGGRALSILAVLIEQPGELVAKQDLIARVWGQTVVEESNLKVHIAALRRALGKGGKDNRYVVTISGQGYRFVAPVSLLELATAPPPVPVAWAQMEKLPVPSTHTIGRAENIATLLRAMETHRLVSIVGPGGIGKSTLMLPVAEAFIARSEIELCFVDLGPLSDARFVASALAAALGLAIRSDDEGHSLLAVLRERRLLIVFDSCEHVIEEVAVLVDRIIAGARGVQVLATSREPLRSTGEYVHRLAPLAYPATDKVNAAQALEYSAIQLFVLRASESLEGYRLTDADAPAVAEICRRLDGIAFAIELAATRMDALCARELAALLDDRFRLLKRGRRSGSQRHRSLEAAFDWSYEYLPEHERSLLCALSVFAGTFTLDAAIGLCADTGQDATTMIVGVSDLVAKSLLSADVGGPCVYYRLLDTTKAYALEKLELRGDMALMRRRHLAYHRAICERASAEWEVRSGVDWLTSYGRGLDDVRAALAWAFSPGGDVALGIALTVAAIPLWMELSLLEEGRHCIERALNDDDPGARPSARDEMRLRAALGAATLYASGPLPETNAAWTRVLELADEQQDSEYQLMALWGMATYRSYLGEFEAVRQLSARFGALAASKKDQAAIAGMERLIGTALHFSGHQEAAQQRLDGMLSQYVATQRRSSMARFQLDQRSAALGTLANVLWLRGYPDRALYIVKSALKQARDVGHAASLMNAIATAAFPITYFVGDHGAAEDLSAELTELLTRNPLPLWQTLSRCIRATLQLRRGEAAALPLLHEAVGDLQAGGFRLRLACHWGTLAAALGAHGMADAGLAIVGEALSFCESGEERWFHAELLRIQGQLVEPDDAAAAARAYRQALALARQQGALAWELRAALNLAQLSLRQGDADEARQVLSAVHEKFSEGYDTPDLLRARVLLNPAP